MPDRVPSPFRRLRREVLVENRWHRYCRDRYLRADGSEGDYYYVDMPGAVGIVPLFEDGSVVLCRQYRYLLGTWLWEFPIGGLAPGDDPEAKAREELAEEAGLEARRWTLLGAFAPYKGVSTEVTRFFLARDLREIGQRLEPEEAIEVHRIPLDEARRRLLEQPLGDGQSWGGLLLLDRWRADAAGERTS